MQIDHVIIAVNDLHAAATLLRDRLGLNAIGGGTHPMGTANRVVPLPPPQYIELLAIGDEKVAAANPFGRGLQARLAGGDCLLGWAVSVSDIEAEAARLGRPLIPGEWHGPDGTVGRWHNIFADIDDFDKLPFFIRYEGENSDRHEARYAEADSPARPGCIAWLEVGGERQRMTDWLGDDSLPLLFDGANPGLHTVAIDSPHGEIVIRNNDL